MTKPFAPKTSKILENLRKGFILIPVLHVTHKNQKERLELS